MPLEPNACLASCLSGRRADRELVRHIARRIRDRGYGMRSYFEDCVAAFPELELFFVVGSTTSSGISGPKDAGTHRLYLIRGRSHGTS